MSDRKKIEDIIGSIKRNFECPICLELMVNPASTKCDHKFCRQCILKVIRRKPSVSCPLCKVPVTKRSLQDLVEWKKLVDKVRQLTDAYKQDLLEEDLYSSCKGNAAESSSSLLCVPSQKEAIKTGIAVELSPVQKRRQKSLKFWNDSEEPREERQLINSTKAEPFCGNIVIDKNGKSDPSKASNIKRGICDSIPSAGLTDRNPKQQIEDREEESTRNIVSLSSDKFCDSSDDDGHYLITGGYEGELETTKSFKPIKDHKIFKSRSSGVFKQAELGTVNVCITDDPYVFKGSQPTPGRKKLVSRKTKHTGDVDLFQDISALPVKIKRKSACEISSLRQHRSKNGFTELNNLDNGEADEIQALNEKIIDAESYNLVLSQQIQNSDSENKAEQKRLEISRPRRYPEKPFHDKSSVLPSVFKCARKEIEKTCVKQVNSCVTRNSETVKNAGELESKDVAKIEHSAVKPQIIMDVAAFVPVTNDSSSEALAKHDTDASCHLSKVTVVEDRHTEPIKSNGEVSADDDKESFKPVKNLKLLKETDVACFSKPSGNNQTRSGSCKRRQFHTVETKWQKKNRKSVTANDEKKKIIEEFSKLEVMQEASYKKDSAETSGVEQGKNTLEQISIKTGYNNEDDKQRTYRSEPILLDETAVDISSHSCISCIPNSVESVTEETAITEKLDSAPNSNIPEEKLPCVKLNLKDEASLSLPSAEPPTNNDRVIKINDSDGQESQLLIAVDSSNDTLPKSGSKQIRKTFSLNASPEAREKLIDFDLLTDSIDTECVIGEAVRGMLGELNGRPLTEDDFSTQEVEMQTAISKLGQPIKKKSECSSEKAQGLNNNANAEEWFLKTFSKSGELENWIEEDVGVVEKIDGNVCVETTSDNDIRIQTKNHSSDTDDPLNSAVLTVIDSGRENKASHSDIKLQYSAIKGDSSSTNGSNSYSLLLPAVCTTLDKKSIPHNETSNTVGHLPSDINSISSSSCELILNSIDEKIAKSPTEFKQTTDLNSTNEAKLLMGLKRSSELQQAVASELASAAVADSESVSDCIYTNSQMIPKPVETCKSVDESNSEASMKPTFDKSGIDLMPCSVKKSEEVHDLIVSICHQVNHNKEIENKGEKELEENKETDTDESDAEALPVSHTNLTSSGNMSSESEVFPTQQRLELELEVKTMEEEIAKLKAELNRGVKNPGYNSEIMTEHLTSSDDEDPTVSAVGDQQKEPIGSELVSEEKIIVQNFNSLGLKERSADDLQTGNVAMRQGPWNKLGVGTADDDDDDNLKNHDLFKQNGVTETLSDDNSSSDVDLFGSEMSDVVAIPQTPTPTKDKYSRKRISHTDSEVIKTKKVTEMSPRSPTPPAPSDKELEKCPDDSVFVTRSKRMKVQYSSDESTPDKKREQTQKNFNFPNAERYTMSKTPKKTERLLTVSTTSKQLKSATLDSSASIRQSSTQPVKVSVEMGKPFPHKKDWILVATGINRTSEQPYVEEFVQKLGCRFSQKFTNGTTHVLVKAVKEGSRRCQRTLKYFQGIAHRSWVISIEWVINSIKMDRLLPEERYEITGDVASNDDHFGPTNARLSGVQLLRKFEICCLGAFDDLTRDDLRGLAEACGASSLQDPAMFSFDVHRTQVIIVEGSSSDSGQQHIKRLYKKFSVPIVAKEWLLDSVGTYDVKSLDEYTIYPLLPT